MGVVKLTYLVIWASLMKQPVHQHGLMFLICASAQVKCCFLPNKLSELERQLSHIPWHWSHCQLFPNYLKHRIGKRLILCGSGVRTCFFFEISMVCIYIYIYKYLLLLLNFWILLLQSLSIFSFLPCST